MDEPTIREQIVDLQLALLKDKHLLPAQTRHYMVEAGFLYGCAMSELRAAEALYMARRVEIASQEPIAARVKMIAEATPEHRTLGEAEDTVRLALAVSQQAKICVRSLDEELRLAR